MFVPTFRGSRLRTVTSAQRPGARTPVSSTLLSSAVEGRVDTRVRTFDKPESSFYNARKTWTLI